MYIQNYIGNIPKSDFQKKLEEMEKKFDEIKSAGTELEKKIRITESNKTDIPSSLTTTGGKWNVINGSGTTDLLYRPTIYPSSGGSCPNCGYCPCCGRSNGTTSWNPFPNQSWC